jgi:signal peptidase I
VRKLVRAQQDLLAPEAIRRVNAAVENVRQVLRQGISGEILEQSLQELEQVVQKNLRPYPNPRWRENIEVFLVTGAIVLALRTFFIQPMAIPTGSAQPTLWGIVQEDLRDDPDFSIPGALQRFVAKWWSGISYFHVVAKESGELHSVAKPRLVFPFVKMETFSIGDERYRVFSSSSFESVLRRGLGLDQNAPVPRGIRFQAGQTVIKLRLVAGDHLFVNRMIYNFKRPERGEIIVFSSEGIPGLIPNTHYIKRLVGLPGDRIQIGNDRHLVVNGKRLDASTPGFSNVYGFDPDDPPRESRYSGHVNDAVGILYSRRSLAPLFPDEDAVYVVPPRELLAMGDNTMNSHDGRSWGAFPQEKLVGRSSFVFWPITERFGWGYR